MEALPSVGWAYPLNWPESNCCGVCDPAAADRGAAGNPSETVRFTNNSSGRNTAHPTSRAAARPTPIQSFLFMVPPQKQNSTPIRPSGEKPVESSACVPRLSEFLLRMVSFLKPIGHSHRLMWHRRYGREQKVKPFQEGRVSQDGFAE